VPTANAREAAAYGAAAGLAVGLGAGLMAANKRRQTARNHQTVTIDDLEKEGD